MNNSMDTCLSLFKSLALEKDPAMNSVQIKFGLAAWGRFRYYMIDLSTREAVPHRNGKELVMGMECCEDKTLPLDEARCYVSGTLITTDKPAAPFPSVWSPPAETEQTRIIPIPAEDRKRIQAELDKAKGEKK